MIATIAKRFTFDAAHHLPTVPVDHKCHRMHGHTYEVELVLRGPVGADGFVLDYAVIAEMWQPIHDALDHRCLNDVPGLEVPSTEVLAGWILRRLNIWKALTAVRIKESSTTWCEMTRDDSEAP